MPRKAKGKAKTAPPPTVPEKVPQAHGGALLAGGMPGNKGGGRLPFAVREAALEGAAKAIPKLIAHLDDKDNDVVQGAADKLLKYGLGTQKDVRLTMDDVKDRLARTLDTIRKHAPPEITQRIMNEIKEHWT